MRRILIAMTILLVALAGCSSQTSSQDKAKDVYNIMVTAANGHRDLTASEEKTVKAYDRSRISLNDKDKLGNAIHAMYFNFYETTTGESQHFEQAKTLAEKYLN